MTRVFGLSKASWKKMFMENDCLPAGFGTSYTSARAKENRMENKKNNILR